MTDRHVCVAAVTAALQERRHNRFRPGAAQVCDYDTCAVEWCIMLEVPVIVSISTYGRSLLQSKCLVETSCCISCIIVSLNLKWKSWWQIFSYVDGFILPGCTTDPQMVFSVGLFWFSINANSSAPELYFVCCFVVFAADCLGQVSLEKRSLISVRPTWLNKSEMRINRTQILARESRKKQTLKGLA